MNRILCRETVTVLRLKGTWFEMWRQYGDAMKKALRYVLWYSSLLATEASDRYLLPTGIPCGVEFLDRFLEGVSAGSGLTKEELVRINGVEVAYGEELMRWLGVQTAGKCSTLALFGDKTPDGRMIFGRN